MASSLSIAGRVLLRRSTYPRTGGCPIDCTYLVHFLHPGSADRLVDYSWLYAMHIAQDANFRLNNRARKGKANDPPLQPGSAYMVSAEEVYEYIKDFVDEKEVRISSLTKDASY
jgi:hypothetical protein